MKLPKLSRWQRIALVLVAITAVAATAYAARKIHRGAVTIQGALTVDGASTLTGAQTLTGATTLSSTLTVTGAQTFTGATTMSSDATLSGAFFGVGSHRDAIRFCGQGPNGTTATYISPDTHDGNGSEYASTHCDAEDNTTEATADEVLYNSAFEVTGMVCELSDGGTDDTVTFTLRDDTADTAATCNVTLDGSGVETCTYTGTSTITVAAGSAVAVEIVADTDDDCSACDALCTVFIGR